MRKKLIALHCLLMLGCADQHVALVTKGDAQLQGGKFCEAYLSYQKAVSENPELSSDSRFTSNTFFAKKECVTASYQWGNELIAKGDLEGAIFQYKKALTLDKEHKKSHQALERTFNVRAEKLNRGEDSLKEAEELSATKNWVAAREKYTAALALNPNHQRAQQGLQESMEQIRRSEESYTSALALTADKKWRAAVENLNRSLETYPGNALAQEKLLLVQAELKQARELYLQGMSLVRKEKRKQGVQLLADALGRDPELEEARRALVALYFQSAARLEEEGKLGNAVRCYQRALAVAPAEREARQRLASAEEQIRQRIVINLALLPFREYGRDPELSDALYNALRKKMAENDKALIKVVDSKVMEKLAQEKDVPLEKLSEGKDTSLLKGCRGAQAVVVAKVAAFKISNERKVEKMSKEYQSGTTRKRNPEYDKAAEDLRLAQSASEATQQAANQLVGGLLGSMVKVVGGGSVVAMRNKLNSTPEFIEEPVMRTWHYKVIHHKKRGTISVGYRVVDTEDAKVIAEETVPAEIELNGDSVENPNPEIGIEDTPLPFESDDEIRAATINKETEVLAEKLSAAASKHALTYFIQAERSVAAGDSRQAVENFCNFVYSVAEGREDLAPQLKRSKEYLANVDLY